MLTQKKLMLNKPKSLLFFDVDGTLIDEESHVFIESAKEALLKAKENGHMVFINSGRTWVFIEQRLKDMGFDGYLCGCGTNVFIQGREMFHHTMKPEICRELPMQLSKWGILAVMEGYEHMYYDRETIEIPVIKETTKLCYKTGPDVLRYFDDPDISFDKFIALCDENSQMDKMKAYLGESYQFIDRGPMTKDHWLYEIVPAGYTKGTAIEYTAKTLGVPMDLCYVFGDSSNDMPMFDVAKNSIAMGNAPDSIKAAASYVTKPIREDGIYHAMKHFGFI